MPFHKRRRMPAKNKNQAKAQRRLQNADLPSLESLYPAAEKLAIHLQFNDAKGNFLDEKTLTFGPKDEVDLRVSCLGPCGDGQMDLESKLQEVIQKRGALSESRGKCARVLYAGSADTCGYELLCRVEVDYRS